MDILLNGAPYTLEESTTLQTLVEALALGQRRVAIEVNREIVPRSRFASHALQEGDRVEIVHALGGG